MPREGKAALDFAAILIIPSAAIAAITVVGLSVIIRGGKIGYPVLISFAIAFLAWLYLLRPWEEIRLNEWPFLLAAAGLIAIWVAAGTLIGAALALWLAKVIKRLRGARDS